MATNIEQKRNEFLSAVGYDDWIVNQSGKIRNRVTFSNLLGILHTHFANIMFSMSQKSWCGWIKKMIAQRSPGGNYAIGHTKYVNEISEDENKSKKSLQACVAAAEAFWGYVFDNRPWQKHQWGNGKTHDDVLNWHESLQKGTTVIPPHKEHLSYNTVNNASQDELMLSVGMRDYALHMLSGGSFEMKNAKLFCFTEASTMVQKGVNASPHGMFNSGWIYLVSGFGWAEKVSPVPINPDVDHTVYRYSDINMIKRRFAHFDLLLKEATISGISISGNKTCYRILSEHIIRDHKTGVDNKVSEAKERLETIGDSAEFNTVFRQRVFNKNNEINDLEEEFCKKLFDVNTQARDIITGRNNQYRDDIAETFTFEVNTSVAGDPQKSSYFESSKVSPSMMFGVQKLFAISKYVDNIDVNYNDDNAKKGE